MSPKSKTETQPVAFRLPKPLIDALDRYAAELGRQHPGLDFNRSDAARVLLRTALERAETAKPKKRSGRG